MEEKDLMFTAVQALLSMAPSASSVDQLDSELTIGAIVASSSSETLKDASSSYHSVTLVPISDNPSSNRKMKRDKVAVDSDFCVPIAKSHTNESLTCTNQSQTSPVPMPIVRVPNFFHAETPPSLAPPTLNDFVTFHHNHRRHSGFVSCASSTAGDSYSVGSQSDWSDRHCTTPSPSLAAANQRFYEGTTSLALKSDEESLSPLHCFMRLYCVEAFTATAEDVSTPRYGRSHGRNIDVGQVGIQCIHCKHRPYCMRQERAVCFPSSLKNIYHSIETWQRRHSLVCKDIPTWAKKNMTDLMNKSRSGAGGRRQYWEEAAKRVGMVDTEHGIRFIRPPGEIPSACEEEEISNESVALQDNPSQPVVSSEDKELVTDFLFKLLDQMEVCYFSEQDRTGGRSKVKDCPIGYPGLQCKHCAGKAGFGRYFPISITALTSANSDRNIFNHILKCRRCPTEIREDLEYFYKQEKQGKNRRGSRKLFFRRVWERMHGAPQQQQQQKRNECTEHSYPVLHSV